MTEEEMRNLCAEALGWKHLGAVGVEPPKRGEPDPKGLWCLSGGNDWWVDPKGFNVCGPCSGIPDPLNNDTDAMALVRKLRLDILWHENGDAGVGHFDGLGAVSANLNTAICECVAQMQKAKEPA